MATPATDSGLPSSASPGANPAPPTVVDLAAPMRGAGHAINATADADAPYRHLIADLIFKYSSEHGARSNTDTYRQVMEITNRTMGTVKNWLSYCVNLPDLASMVRVMHHWKIPPEAIIPRGVESLLGIETEASAAVATPAPRSSLQQLEADQILISLYESSEASKVDRALSKYTDNPKSAMLVRQEGNEMGEQIRPGELMLVDPTCETIKSSGIYLLKFSAGANVQTCVRVADLLMGEPAVRLSGGGSHSSVGVEVLPLVQGLLPSHISVLGRVVAVLRPT